jgi:hypothetical protein
MDWRHSTEITKSGLAAFSELKNPIVWVKDNAGMALGKLALLIRQLKQDIANFI